MSEAAAASGFGPGGGIARVLSDDRLAQRAVKGDERAFAAIFRRYHQGLYRFCLAIVGNSVDAQDALQNTMVKVLRALPGEERQIELKPWLYRIAHNESIELLRRRRETSQVDAGLVAPGAGLAEEVESRERLRRLLADLDELPERQRATLVMRELAGLGYAEIGAALGTSAAVARQTLYEARLGLRQMDEGREMSCATVTKALSDGDGRVARRRDVRAHLRTCADCRRFREDIAGRERDLAALSPLPAVAAAGLLHGVLGGGGAGGGGLAAALGGGAANSVGAGAVLKGAAAVVLVGAVGVGVADRGGLVNLPWPGEGGSGAIQVQQSPAGANRAEGKSAGLIDSPGEGSAAGAAAGVGGQVGASAGQGGGAQADAPPMTKAAHSEAASPNTATTGPDEGKTNATGTAPTSVAQDSASTEGPSPGQGSSEGGSSTQGSSTAHPHGKGHAKELPSASQHGQQTAAANKNGEHGSSGGQGQAGNPSKPTHPEHPEHPSTPSLENGPPPSPPGTTEEPSPGPATEPTSPAAEGSPGQGKGKGKKP